MNHIFESPAKLCNTLNCLNVNQKQNNQMYTQFTYGKSHNRGKIRWFFYSIREIFSAFGQKQIRMWTKKYTTHSIHSNMCNLYNQTQPHIPFVSKLVRIIKVQICLYEQFTFETHSLENKNNWKKNLQK